MRLVTTKRFDSELRRLVKKDSKYVIKVAKTFKLAIEQIDHPSLRLHKLVGKDNYSISVDMKIRILVHIEGEEVYLLRIGSHDSLY